ncbi:tetratricopeptide repeat protein [Mesoterricola silvestris]|uniref:Tetratricopeptide repeat protein n=1 Tax=Mesoterricola silvestris TaxID=2927979 RepID=A0AA48H2A3_9BACT|nr:hypothetical protein [Mesoterricola silvestris]BDU74698.1 hypothetical protein METEAL_38720 [Mesoterricola silvestris]
MRRIVLLLALFAAASTAVLEYRRNLRPSSLAPLQLRLASAEAFPGLTPLERRGFGVLLKDSLEYRTGLAVVESEAVLPGGPRDALTVALARTGGRIGMHLVLDRASRPQRAGDVWAETPAGAVGAALGWLGLEDGARGALLPRDPAAFWELARMTVSRPQGPIQGDLEVCAGILAREPGCAEAWLARARLLNNHILDDNRAPANLQDRCEQDYLTALALAPDCPRAATLFGRFRTEIGNQRAALDLLLGAVRRSPKAPRLYEAVAYAARSAGLLEGASRALARRDALSGPSRGEAEITENTYLYLGDLDRFEAVLGPGSSAQPDTLRDFYRGYVRLLRGDPPGAAGHFRRAAFTPGGNRAFMDLAGVYVLALDGRRDEALDVLRRLWAERVPIRIPDGEFTFKLAEAFGYLGSPSEAQDVANRAFAQGFGCLRWYEHSPFLACARGTLRWAALEQHLKERLALMEASYPRKKFNF